jgi:hypothetical protein
MSPVILQKQAFGSAAAGKVPQCRE